MTEDRIASIIKQNQALLDPFLTSHKNVLHELAASLVSTFHQEGRLLLLGSGPFGSLAGLLGQAFIHRQTMDRPALPALPLTNDAGLATFLAADDQSHQFFSRQLRAMATPRDTVLALAGTEICAAVADGLETAQHLGCRTALICSEQTTLPSTPPDLCIALPGETMPRLLEGCLLTGNILCSLVEAELFGI